MVMQEKWIKIIPNDTLFFGKTQFTMGSETFSETLFPPFPSTIYGALGAFLIFQTGDLKTFKERKEKKEITPIEIIGPFLFREDEAFFHPPLDLVKIKEKKGRNEKNELSYLNFIEKPKITFAEMDYLTHIHIYEYDEDVDQPEGLLSKTYMKDYLENKKGIKIISTDEFWQEEWKIGIARERKTLTSREGYLYRIPMVRMNENTGFIVKVCMKKGEFPNKGLLQLGGEAKTAYFEVLEDNPLGILENLEINWKNKLFKLYLATPALFKKGWLPEWIDEKTLEGTINNIRLKLIGAAVGKYINIGGWDMLNNRPKKMYRAVPAGSVYYFQVLDDSDFRKLRDTFHLKNISDELPEEEDIKFSQKGFGLSLIGGVE